MNYEKIKEDKIKEAEEVYKKVNDYNYNQLFNNYQKFNKPVDLQNNHNSKGTLHWTRLSINSNQGQIIGK